MKSSRKELKQKAKEQLRGQWLIPVLVTLIIGVISFVTEKINNGLIENSSGSMLFSLISLFISLIISIAVTAFYLKLGRGKKVEFSDLLIDGRTMGKGIGIQLLTTLILIPVVIVSVIIFVLIAVFGFGNLMTGAAYAYKYMDIASLASMASGLIWLFIIALLVISVPLIIIGSYFSLAIMFICEDKNRGVWECIRLSFQHMNGNLWRYIILQLSFIGWGILSIFTLGIGLLWLIPYITVTEVNFFNDVTGFDDRNLTANNCELDF